MVVNCTCPGSRSGPRCEISPCASSPCFSQVNCTETADGLNYTCGHCPIINDTYYIGDGINCTGKDFHYFEHKRRLSIQILCRMHRWRLVLNYKFIIITGFIIQYPQWMNVNSRTVLLKLFVIYEYIWEDLINWYWFDIVFNNSKKFLNSLF